MTVVNTAELKNHTNEILRKVHRGEPVAVTRHGKPYAALLPLSEETLEDFLWEHSPKLRRLIREAEADIKAGRLVSWAGFLRRERSAKKRSAA